MRVHDRDHIGAALRRFKKLLERSGLLRTRVAEFCYGEPNLFVRKSLGATKGNLHAGPG
jgi:ribosomal protein S21